jgi:glutamate synthase (NADPH/NADH) large chain
VVEGTGDHGCEYMTAGTVIVLGETGRNFAAGMSGGVAYVYDPDGEFAPKCNLSMVSLEPVLAGDVQAANVDKSIWHHRVMGGERETDEAILRNLIERHFKHTGSTRARNLLDDWARSRAQFVKVFPTDYKRALGEMYAAKAALKNAEKVAA